MRTAGADRGAVLLPDDRWGITGMNKFVGASLALSLVAMPCAAQAEDMKPEKLVELLSECAYVVHEVGAEKAGIRYGSEQWQSVLAEVSQKAGIDPLPFLHQAKAKYERSAKKMGADWTYKRMIARAQDCDQQL